MVDALEHTLTPGTFTVIMVGGPDADDLFWFEQKSYTRAEAEAIIANFRKALDVAAGWRGRKD